jgi:antitoxin (DNA-binding transcriptional repressor) of toxin-antitoxin stability system
MGHRPGDKVSQIKNEGNVEVTKTGQKVARTAPIAARGFSSLLAKKPRQAGNSRWQSDRYR